LKPGSCLETVWKEYDTVLVTERGLLPADPTVVVGQPMAVRACRPLDPMAAMAGAAPAPKGDAAQQIDVGDGTWTESLRQRYADRVVKKLARQLPNLESAILKQVVLSPADLATGNINLVGGDPYGGSCAADQFS
jgi:phytoene dehydrogenase-like protein